MRTRRAAAAVVMLGLAAVTAGCSTPPGTVAVVEGNEISQGDLDRVTEELGPYMNDSSPAGVLTALVQSEAGLALAGSYDIEVTDEEGRAFLDELVTASGGEVLAWGHDSLVIARMQVAGTQLSSATDDVAGEYQAALAEIDVTVNPRYGAYDPATGTIGGLNLPWIVLDDAAAPLG